jgi:ABC-type phosphate/phosphonate transport system substrate-binding protein
VATVPDDAAAGWARFCRRLAAAGESIAGPEFPADVRTQIEDALVAFAGTEAWGTSIGSADFYGWSGIAPATDAEYDMVRAMVEATGYQIK